MCLLLAPAVAARELRIGIIHYNRPPADQVEVDPWLARYFEEVSRAYADLGMEVEIVPVHGNYYQVLQWFRDGEIDGAVVSSFLAYLLTSDENIAVYPVIEISRLKRGVAPLDDVPATVRAVQDGRDLDDPVGKFQECLAKVAEAVRDPLLPRQCEFRFVSHLSATGFLLPMLAIEEVLDPRLAWIDPPLSAKESEEFWAKVAEWSRFTLWHGAEIPLEKGRVTVTFSYAGSGRPGTSLQMKRRIPILQDALLLGRPRRNGGESSWRKDPFREEALLREAATGANGDLYPALVFPSPRGYCVENAASPWVNAGLAMEGLEDVGGGYRSTASWCESRREAFAKIVETRLPGEPSRALETLFKRWYEEGDYPFTTEELIDLLKFDQQIRKAPRAALVLPGGGVRATYQSVILDWLYSGYIANAGSYVVAHSEPATASPDRDRVTSEPPQDRLVINGIAGTSGGALLGYLASRRNAERSSELTTQWVTASDEVKTTPLAIFPAFGVLRWLSAIALLAVFAATAAIHLPNIPPAPLRQVPFWYTSILSMVVIGSPFFIWRNAIDDPTYPQPWEILALLVVLLVAHVIHSISAANPAAGHSSRRLRFGITILLAGVGSIYMLVEGNPHGGLESESERVRHLLLLLERSELWTPLSACALLLVVAGLSLIASARGMCVDPNRRSAYLHGWMVLLALLTGTGLIFLIGLQALHVTTLELTGDYWIWIFVGALFTAKLIVTAGRIFPNARFQSGIAFLSSPSGTAPFPYTPTMSLAIWGGLAAMVWLVFVAPSLYSAGRGRNAFSNAIDVNRRARERVPLVVSMTGFGVQSPRFESPSGDFYASDARWKEVRPPHTKYTTRFFALPQGDFRDAVFASASPFPIYPAAKVQTDSKPKKPGLFVDGGFAHLVPIEATTLFGAAQVLVIENVARQETGTRRAEAQRLGSLTTNMGNALNFLFERSQDLDLKTARHAMVATIAPDWTGPNPFLMDFREPVIRKLKAEAMNDLRGHRIGRVRSWGQPGSGREHGK
ncbi:MAG TPA: hypothetical protein VF883_18520 [Thermoanaerobaculia bacterium]